MIINRNNYKTTLSLLVTPLFNGGKEQRDATKLQSYDLYLHCRPPAIRSTFKQCKQISSNRSLGFPSTAPQNQMERSFDRGGRGNRAVGEENDNVQAPEEKLQTNCQTNCQTNWWENSVPHLRLYPSSVRLSNKTFRPRLRKNKNKIKIIYYLRRPVGFILFIIYSTVFQQNFRFFFFFHSG